jgi:hypothetical protein
VYGDIIGLAAFKAAYHAGIVIFIPLKFFEGIYADRIHYDPECSVWRFIVQPQEAAKIDVFAGERFIRIFQLEVVFNIIVLFVDPAGNFIGYI